MDVLIALLIDLETPEPHRTTVTEKIYRLADLGVPQAEIAEILRKPSNYVSAVLSRRKK